MMSVESHNLISQYLVDGEKSNNTLGHCEYREFCFWKDDNGKMITVEGNLNDWKFDKDDDGDSTEAVRGSVGDEGSIDTGRGFSMEVVQGSVIDEESSRGRKRGGCLDCIQSVEKFCVRCCQAM
jgi:hypothetical protein